jgi:hypothetical protein
MSEYAGSASYRLTMAFKASLGIMLAIDTYISEILAVAMLFEYQAGGLWEEHGCRYP